MPPSEQRNASTMRQGVTGAGAPRCCGKPFDAIPPVVGNVWFLVSEVSGVGSMLEERRERGEPQVTSGSNVLMFQVRLCAGSTSAQPAACFTAFPKSLPSDLAIRLCARQTRGPAECASGECLKGDRQRAVALRGGVAKTQPYAWVCRQMRWRICVGPPQAAPQLRASQRRRYR
jgi:hypothetical protein